MHLRRYFEGERSRLDFIILCVAVWAFVQVAAMVLGPALFSLVAADPDTRSIIGRALRTD